MFRAQVCLVRRKVGKVLDKLKKFLLKHLLIIPPPTFFLSLDVLIIFINAIYFLSSLIWCGIPFSTTTA